MDMNAGGGARMDDPCTTLQYTTRALARTEEAGVRKMREGGAPARVLAACLILLRAGAAMGICVYKHIPR